MKPKQCVFVNDAQWLLGQIDTEKFSIINELFSCYEKIFCIPKLGSLVEERMDSIVLNCGVISGSVQTKLDLWNKNINSEYFQGALHRICLHEHSKNERRIGSRDHMKGIALLKSYSIKAASSIRCRYVIPKEGIRSSDIDITAANNDANVPSMLVQNENVIYVLIDPSVSEQTWERKW